MSMISAAAKRLADALKLATGSALIGWDVAQAYAAGTVGAAIKSIFAGPTFTGPVTLPGDAAAALHAVPKQQLDAAIADIKDGVTLTGPLVLPGDAAAALQAVPKQQLDAVSLRALWAMNFPRELVGNTPVAAGAWRAISDTGVSVVNRAGWRFGDVFKAQAAGIVRVSIVNMRAFFTSGSDEMLIRVKLNAGYGNPELSYTVAKGPVSASIFLVVAANDTVVVAYRIEGTGTATDVLADHIAYEYLGPVA